MSHIIHLPTDASVPFTEGHIIETLADFGSHITYVPDTRTLQDPDIPFDLLNEDLYDVMDKIRDKLCDCQFRTICGAHTSNGPGATRQVYLNTSLELLSKKLFVPTKSGFMDVNPDHLFWQQKDNIKDLINYIMNLTTAGCLLPLHLAPGLMEFIAQRIFSVTELEYYMAKINPEVLANSWKVSPEEFASLSGFKSHADLYRTVCIGHIPDKKFRIYEMIGEQFDRRYGFRDDTVEQIDQYLSGVYVITSQMVLEITKLRNADAADQAIWNRFINALTEPELRQMLLTFGNTLSTAEHYKIYIKSDKEMSKKDINIITCHKEILINRSLFANFDVLLNLRVYFTDADVIADNADSDADSDIPELVDGDFDSDSDSDYANDISAVVDTVDIVDSLRRLADENDQVMKEITSSLASIRTAIQLTRADPTEWNQQMHEEMVNELLAYPDNRAMMEVEVDPDPQLHD